MNYTKLCLLGAPLVGLAACDTPTMGGQPIEPLGQAEESARIYSNDVGDLGDALTDGQTLTARQVALAGIMLNYDGGDTALTEADEFTVRLNEEGEVTLVLEGREIVFTPADRDPHDDGNVYGYFNESNCFDDNICDSLYSYSGEIDELKSNGNGWSTVLRAQSNQILSDGRDLAAFAIIGTETTDADLPTLATATYDGLVRVDLVPATGFQNNGESRTRIRSDLSMTADFGAGTISGIIDEITYQAPGEDAVAIDGTVAMTEAQFAINGFQGGFVGDETFNANTDFELGEGSSYSGAFYGPEAQNVAGTISMTGSLNGTASNGIGFFTADQ